MAVAIRRSLAAPAALQPKKQKSGHTRPASVALLDLNSEDSRVRVGHMLTLFGISHSTLYARIKAGAIPEPDGRNPRPWWHSANVREALASLPPKSSRD